MLERFGKSIQEIIGKKREIYDVNISKDVLPFYFEAARMFSVSDVKLGIVAKEGESYMGKGYSAILRKNVVRIRVTTKELRHQTLQRKEFFDEVRRIEKRIKDGKWSISTETKEKLQDIFPQS